MGPVGTMREGIHVSLELGKVFPWESVLVLIKQIVS
jgi:hypothetical protein